MGILSEEERNDAKRDLHDWHVTPEMLEREFAFNDFKTALEFVNHVGEIAEELNHHPDIFLSWGKVHLQITTHEAGGLTEKDVELAMRIETP